MNCFTMRVLQELFHYKSDTETVVRLGMYSTQFSFSLSFVNYSAQIHLESLREGFGVLGVNFIPRNNFNPFR